MKSVSSCKVWIQNNALILTLIILSINFWLWLCCRDYSALASESAKHLVKTYEMHFAFLNGTSWAKALNTITYPPLFYVPAVILYAITGIHSETLALASIWPFVLITAIAVFGIAKQLHLPQAEAITASILTAAALTVSLQEDGYIIEYAILSQTTLALYLFMASDYMHKRLPSLALGVVCGWGVLTKWTFVAYCPIAVAVSAVLWITEPAKRRRRTVNWLLALTVFILLANMWYSAGHWNAGTSTLESNFKATFNHFTHSQASEISVRTAQIANESQAQISCWGPIALIGFLVYDIVPVHLTPLIAWGIIACFAYWGVQSSPKPHRLTVILSLAFTLVLFTFYPSQALFSPQKTLRHLGPAVPLAMLAAVWGTAKLGKGRGIVLGAVNAIALLSALGWAATPLHSLLTAPCFRPAIYSVASWQCQDPLGWLSAPKRTAMDDLVQDIKAQVSQGFTPVFCFGTVQDFQPLLAELYGQRGPAAVATIVGGKLLFIDTKTQFTEPDTPILDLSKPMYIYQDQQSRESSPKTPGDKESVGTGTSNPEESDHLDSQNIAALRRLLASNRRDAHSTAELRQYRIIQPRWVHSYYLTDSRAN
ncbi:hypothetical protein IJT17_07500 [bacterium]|nr:hypothetical protein [bacterium]